ncbi:MAG: fructosamine kinase family protein [Bacteroidia bacterium]|nr:fructosamine kinase family protein [Bacteroidia bacterium]
MNTNRYLYPCFSGKSVIKIDSISGGCINQTYQVTLNTQEILFVKINSSNQKDNFIQEKFNLEFLKGKSSLKIPAVIDFCEEEQKVVLILEYLEKTNENKDFEFLFGKGLAELHKNTEQFFGWYQDNYIGSLEQHNKQSKTWTEFFVTQRLEPLVKVCFDRNMLGKSDIRNFEHLYLEIENIFPAEPPALLHGDLWTGNRMNTVHGPAIFDPACYFGHREMDIAMLNLFGSVSELFYEGYNSLYPLEKNFVHRRDICNLYPLLVHAVLFGYAYIYDIQLIIKKF